MNKRRGFVLGVVLLVCIVMAAFIFSFNSIVRSRNIQAHHMATSETASTLALSAIRICASEIGKVASTTIAVACPELFTKKASDLSGGLNIGPTTTLCNKLKSDVQTFFDTMTEIREPGVMTGGLPQCDEVSISLTDIGAINPDTIAAQFQEGRDPIEKYGKICITCKITCMGLSKIAKLTRQFRVVSMVPGPYCRFSLFVSHTPYPDSYNAMGSNFDGTVDSTYSHPPAGNKTFRRPLIIFNGTDTENITPTVAFRDADKDKKHLKNRGWIFLGPSGSTNTGPVFLKIPSGFNPSTGGSFMLGWPSANTNPILLPEVVADPTNFAPDSGYPNVTYRLGAKYQGFYTYEPGNPEGAGARNLWPGLTAGASYVASDRVKSASSWIYPYGNQSHSSRTLVVGPVLAGLLKFYFIKGTDNVSGADFKGLFGPGTSASYSTKKAENKNLKDYLKLWGGADPAIVGDTFFKNGFNSFKLLMPYNSMPSPSTVLPTNGISFNLIFDFMKYNKTDYPDLDSTPSIAASSYDANKFLVPRAHAMRTCAIKGVHPISDVGIFFKENGKYNPSYNPENCYFYGDLSKFTNLNSDLVSKRITHCLDLSDCSSTAEESAAIDNYLFTKIGSYNIPTKSGIFFIKRRPGINEDYGNAVSISARKVKINKPLIVVFDKGSAKIDYDITSNLKDGSPEFLFSMVMLDGDIYLTGSGMTRTVYGYLSALCENGKGRLLNRTSGGSGITRFIIYGGLAMSEIGLYDSTMSDTRHVGTTMSCFLDGGEIHYNSRFNPSSPAYHTNRMFLSEGLADKIEITGGL